MGLTQWSKGGLFSDLLGALLWHVKSARFLIQVCKSICCSLSCFQLVVVLNNSLASVWVVVVEVPYQLPQSWHVFFRVKGSCLFVPAFPCRLQFFPHIQRFRPIVSFNVFVRGRAFHIVPCFGEILVKGVQLCAPVGLVVSAPGFG